MAVILSKAIRKLYKIVQISNGIDYIVESFNNRTITHLDYYLPFKIRIGSHSTRHLIISIQIPNKFVFGNQILSPFGQ